MAKKIVFIAALVLLVMVAGGCGKSGDAAGPGTGEKQKRDPVYQTADTILKLKEEKRWAELYTYLHPDVQSAVYKDEFVKTRTAESQRTKVKYKEYTVKDYKMLKAWRDNLEAGKIYADVAEVAYTVRVETAVGEKEIGNTMHLARSDDGQWKYLWMLR